MKRKIVFPNQLLYMMAIAKHGSYTKAAEALHVTQPTLSQQVKLLEELLQTTLFVRDGRKVHLTDAGEIFLHHTKQAYYQIDSGSRAIEDVDNLSRGTLRIGWTPISDHLTCSLIRCFCKQFPGITLSTIDMPADEIEEALTEDHIDIGITFCMNDLPDSKIKGLKRNILFKESLCLVVSKDHVDESHTEYFSAQELQSTSLTLLNSNFSLRRSFDQYCLEQDTQPQVSIETDSLSVILDMVLKVDYATILPKSIAMSYESLKLFDMDPPLPDHVITLISRSQGYTSPASREFVKTALDWADAS